MEVLAYLLADSPSVSADSGPNVTPRILFGSRETEDEGDEDHLQLCSDILLKVKREGTYDALHKNLPFDWSHIHPYDTINPFGDPRQSQYHSLWTFDTQNDLLYYTHRDHRGQMPLSLLRERAVRLADMESLGDPVPPPLSLPLEVDPGRSYWEPCIEIEERLRAFTHRLLRDFHHQWRHILRNRFNLMTLRVLARAIVRLATLDFDVHENNGGNDSRGVHVWITQLPPWEPFETDLERAGHVHIVLCQDIFEGLSSAKRHLLSRDFSATDSWKDLGDAGPQADYMILSVKHIMLVESLVWFGEHKSGIVYLAR